MIRLKNVEKSYKTKAGFTYVLRQINLQIAEGEFITIMGPSAAGKSTLLNIVGMLDHDWEGEYTLDGQAVHALKPKDRQALNRQYVGFVFQAFNLLDSLTVYENLDVPLSYRNVKASQRAAIVCDTLDRFGIVGKKDLYPSQLSGGQQQLVAIARAVIVLGHNLGLEVLAEGVETAAQRDFLAETGCDVFQGYFYGRPMESAQFEVAIGDGTLKLPGPPCVER